ncbi:alpha/beta fold hydrolase [Paraliomyxa miuraensis]|uniref:alpha/beta fold hydrolase n=1 Tax=Paraliomyxa miuraensis TaxID=376150 RepID=UPI00225769DD|nr:alpha/beta fold hydrolase [Paraliomyxa miuraensis]MCX4244962.1 alpha/beta fold hydrolase [Paraliomyxa miuraensis]
MIERLLGLTRLARRTPPAVGLTPADVVHRENKWRLLRYRPTGGGPGDAPRHRTPVLLVPSLINRHYVLDLTPGKSFVEAMVARGHDVFIIDWGTPAAEDRFVDFDEICDRYIGRAVRVAARVRDREGDGSGGKVHLLGYCLGGTLAVIHAAAHPERIASLVALAAPIDFDEAGIMARWVRTKSFDVGALVDAMGNVPWPLMQAAFHLLRPTLPLTKAVSLVERAWDDEFLDGFFAVERWSNDNVSFPGACYRRYIEALYRDNALVTGRLSLAGQPVRLQRITCPTLAVTFEGDHIVPEASGRVLLDLVGSADKRSIRLRGGHVGAVVSRKAATTLWPQLSAWWIEHDCANDGPAHLPGAANDSP